MKIKNILLIDDSEIDNFINKSVLEKANMVENIIAKTSAKEALEYLSNTENEFPNIIFLDIRMPEMDGFEFLNECENFPDELKNKCVIFMLSSSIDPNDALRAEQHKVVKKYLTKPLTQSAFENVVTYI